MITEYKGSANSTSVLRHLVGETITAALQDDSGRIVLVLSSGGGIDFGSFGDAKSPTFGPLNADQVARIIAKRRMDIAQHSAQLGTI
jgi:hypothetical protein